MFYLHADLKSCNLATLQEGSFIVIIKCNPKEIVDTYVLVDITGCSLSVEPLCHDPKDTLINEDGSPIFWELLATHLSVPMCWVTREQRMKDDSIGTVGSQVPITQHRLCIFDTREDGYKALERIQEAITRGISFIDLS